MTRDRFYGFKGASRTLGRIARRMAKATKEAVPQVGKGLMWIFKKIPEIKISKSKIRRKKK